MGGTVGVESEPGRGSEFWFTARLQARSGGTAACPAAPGRGGQPRRRAALKDRHRGARVLIADDNRINQELATELLRLVDLQVEVADNGRIAVEMARRGGFDLILMDMQMPEMDGLEATRLIRTVPELDSTPIVAMTASAFGADRDACLAAGMNDHIGKPVNPATLYEKLLRWLDESRKSPRAGPVERRRRRRRRRRGSTDALDDIDGLDIVRGMSLFAGQRALYMQALGYFVDLYGDGLAAVDRFIAGAPGARARPPAARSTRWAAPPRRWAPSGWRTRRTTSTDGARRSREAGRRRAAARRARAPARRPGRARARLAEALGRGRQDAYLSGIGVPRSTATAVTAFCGEPSTSRSE